jgi:hypothetical protein
LRENGQLGRRTYQARGGRHDGFFRLPEPHEPAALLYRPVSCSRGYCFGRNYAGQLGR